MMFNLFFNLFPVIWLAMFVLIVGMIISSFVKSAKQERKNDVSPRLDVQAKVVAKRTDVSYHRHHHQNHHHTTTSTHYFATFEVVSGDRMELEMDGQDYGMLVEGDCGTLSFQGTRYLGFRRL